MTLAEIIGALDGVKKGLDDLVYRVHIEPVPDLKDWRVGLCVTAKEHTHFRYGQFAVIDAIRYPAFIDRALTLRFANGDVIEDDAANWTLAYLEKG